MKHADLIAALEKAEGPSRELDAAIMRLLYHDATHDRETDTWTMPFAGKPVKVRLALYTASIDAALTLVPQGWIWSVASSGCVWVMPPEMLDGQIVVSGVKHPAIALCIAALRARGAGDESRRRVRADRGERKPARGSARRACRQAQVVRHRATASRDHRRNGG